MKIHTIKKAVPDNMTPEQLEVAKLTQSVREIKQAFEDERLVNAKKVDTLEKELGKQQKINAELVKAQAINDGYI